MARDEIEQVAGYVRIMAHANVTQQRCRPFLGKAYLKLGQCEAIWGYFFQLSSVLASRHATQLDAFGHAFLGLYGASGGVKRFFTELAEKVVAKIDNGAATYYDYVAVETASLFEYSGDRVGFVASHWGDKIKPAVAEARTWWFSTKGAALGAIYPRVARDVFNRTYAMVPKEEWAEARAAGLDLPQEQEQSSWCAVEESQDRLFMAYCEECCPDLYAVLWADTRN